MSSGFRPRRRVEFRPGHIKKFSKQRFKAMANSVTYRTRLRTKLPHVVLYGNMLRSGLAGGWGENKLVRGDSRFEAHPRHSGCR